MNCKILLIVPPVRLSEPPRRFPLGLAYVAAALEKKGLDVSVLDLNLLRVSAREEETLVAKAIECADIVGMGGMITMFNTIGRLGDYVKKYRPHLPVIVGGPIASQLQELILSNSRIDVLVSGERKGRPCGWSN